jgi:hypothetical protein
LKLITINSFKQGSVLVDSTLNFQSSKTDTTSLLNSIRAAIISNTNDPNIPAVDPNKLSVSLESVTESSTSDQTKLALSIALPIAACLMLIVVIISVIFCRYRYK